jgi:hypothetical protein
MKNMNQDGKSRQLQELAGSGYEVQDGQPDVKGWKVQDATSRNFGEVVELLFHEPSKKVRYLVLDLTNNDFHFESRKVIVPIGLANIKVLEKRILLREVSAGQLLSSPDYERGHVDTAMETAVRRLYSGNDEPTLGDREHHDPNFYDNKNYDEEEFYGKWKSQLSSGNIKDENSSEGSI